MPKLDGLRVVVTRAAHQNEELSKLLRTHGAEVIHLPLIGIAPPLNPKPLQNAASNADTYDWIIFSSANALRAFRDVFHGTPESLSARIAAVGPATREAAEQAGFRVHLVPTSYIAESLAEAFSHENLAGRRILIPSAAVTRDVIPAALRERGALVEVVEAYRNVIPQESVTHAPLVFQPPYPDWITFASSSAVDHLVKLIGAEQILHSRLATIGPATSTTVRSHHLPVHAEATTHTVAGLVEALIHSL